jgi:tetratricopeptide (TPR) repeat protein
MPINFNCPNCHKPLRVKDELAGKKGPCPHCKQLVTVPRPSAAQATPLPKPSAAPKVTAPGGAPHAPAPPVDVEAEAAALLADGTAKVEAPQFIDFPCPYCDEPLHLDAALAGKKAPCPSCRRIISVPLPKVEKKDWRNMDGRLPSAAQRPAEPAPEGTWSSTATSRVSHEALNEAGLIPQKRVPRTTGQKVRFGLLVAGLPALVVVLAFVGWRWWAANRQERALRQALAFANAKDAESRFGKAGQAALHTGAGEYFLRTRKPQCAKLVAEQFGQALKLLNEATDADRDLALTELALAWVDAGGDRPDLERELRLKWDDAQKRIQATLGAIRTPEARLEALRGVAGRLVARGQATKVIPLVQRVYSAVDADQAEAYAVVALELRKADETRAAEAADLALRPFDPAIKDRPPLRAAVVAAALVFDKKLPAFEKKRVEDEWQELIGRAEGLARRGELAQAREKVKEAKKFGEEVTFRALVGVAAGAAEANPGDKADVEAAAAAADTVRRLDAAAWPLLRLTQVAIRAGLPEDAQQKVAAAIAVPTVKGPAQLAVLRARLGASPQVVGEDVAAKVEGKGLAHRLARQALARHNVRVDAGWAKTVQGWEEPERAFGALGVALGLQGKD